MPMIDVYAAEGTFTDKHELAQSLANAVMRWEKVPPISLFKNNTAAFIHDLPVDAISNAAGESNYVRGGRARSRKATRCRQGAHRYRGGRLGRRDARATNVGAHYRIARRGLGNKRPRQHE